MAYTPNLTFSGGEYATSTKVNELLASALSIFPVGSLLYIAQSPTTTETTFMGKWLQCNGVAVSRTTYASLWSAFGTTDVYGGGNGTSTFGLPDLRGRIPVAVGTHTDVSAFGKNETGSIPGSADLATRRMKHSHTATNPSHSHGWSATLDNGGAHTHSYSYESQSIGGCTTGGSDTTEFGNTTTGPVLMSTESNGHTHTLTPTVNAGSALQQNPGVAGTPLDQPAYLVGGCWYICYA